MRTATPRRARALTTTRAAATEETFEYQAEVRARRETAREWWRRRRRARASRARRTRAFENAI
jgi:hypothetical protein